MSDVMKTSLNMEPWVQDHLCDFIETVVHPDRSLEFYHYAISLYILDPEYWNRVGWDVMYTNFLQRVKE